MVSVADGRRRGGELEICTIRSDEVLMTAVSMDARLPETVLECSEAWVKSILLVIQGIVVHKPHETYNECPKFSQGQISAIISELCGGRKLYTTHQTHSVLPHSSAPNVGGMYQQS